jgi:F-type H+-transporting ATPase subunit delta
VSRASRTYAKALFEAAGGDAARVADELDAFAGVRTEAPDAWNQLVAPGLPSAVRKGTLDRFLADAHPLVRNVVKVLVDHGRLDEVDEVAADYRTLVKELEHQLDVHVTSAIELGDDLRAKLEQRLGESTGKQVRLHASVDPEIIGGLVVRHGDTLVDTSLRGRLDQLRLALSRPTPKTSSATSSNG